MDQYLGRFGAEGQIERYPAVDLSGALYATPPTVRGIGHGYFVVLPLNSNDETEAILEQVSQYVKGQAASAAEARGEASASRRGKRAEASPADPAGDE